MTRLAFLCVMALVAACGWKRDPGIAARAVAEGPVARIDRQAGGPVAWFEVGVRAGSAHDPPGQEGIAWLTARALREAGAGERTPEQVEDALYRLGIDVETMVDQELASFRVRFLAEDAASVSALLGDMIRAPKLDETVLERLRGEAADWLEKGVQDSDETLGMEILDGWLFQGHPYGHPIRGRAGVVRLLGAEDVRHYLDDRYVRPAFVLGVAGDLAGSAPLRAAADALRARLSEAPPRLYRDVTPRRVPTVQGRHLLVVQKQTDSTGIHFGHPTELSRTHRDWPAMLLAFTALGEHRQGHGRLYRALRGARGLNYGDYAYIEVFRQAGWSSLQETGTARVQNPFYVWLRPTSAQNGAFALKAALWEIERFVRDGLAPDEFARMKAYLGGRIPLWAADPGRRLGWEVEAALLGVPDAIATLGPRIESLSLDEVNAAIRRHIRPGDLEIVVVTSDVEGFRRSIVEGTPTPIVYEGAPPPADPGLVEEDAAIAGYVVGVADARVVPAEGLFR